VKADSGGAIYENIRSFPGESMNCPHCQKELLANYDGAYCPACGNDLPPPPGAARSLDPGQRISWPWFFVCLFTPVLLTMITVRLPSQAGGSFLLIALYGGPVSGIICGAMLARRLGRTDGTKIMLCFVLIPAMIAVCVVMNFFGCLAAGNTLNLR
jgi:hypothetical protein